MKLELWKPFGMTSGDFVRSIRERHGMKRICYAGRLDPFAQGVMLILTDSDVSSMTDHLSHDKTYEFVMVLGIGTTSHDFAGRITSISPYTPTLRQPLVATLHEFIRNYTTQEYPMISSYTVKHDGLRRPLWWFLEHGLEIPSGVPPSKDVTIHQAHITRLATMSLHTFANTALDRMKMVTNPKTRRDLHMDSYIAQYEELKSQHETDPFDPCLHTIHMTMTVSSGFYIRQFCKDFGDKMGCPCVALDITRTKIVCGQAQNTKAYIGANHDRTYKDHHAER